jgi:hypothetical protein
MTTELTKLNERADAGDKDVGLAQFTVDLIIEASASPNVPIIPARDAALTLKLRQMLLKSAEQLSVRM